MRRLQNNIEIRGLISHSRRIEDKEDEELVDSAAATVAVAAAAAVAVAHGMPSMVPGGLYDTPATLCSRISRRGGTLRPFLKYFVLLVKNAGICLFILLLLRVQV